MFIIFATGVMIVTFILTKRSKLDFTFDIGESEKHTIRFTSETMLGKNSVYVDGINKFSSLKLINGDTSYTVVVGDKEIHTLIFQLKMPFLYGAFRQRSCEVYCDGKLLKTVQSGIKV
jgi:hypothetical protein